MRNIYFYEGIKILVDGMEYILKNYIEVSENERPNAQNPLAKFIRTDLPNQFKKTISNSNNYSIKGSAGISHWAKVPWINFLNKNVSSKFIERYYVSYLFKGDMSGFYLSLMFDVRDYRNVNPKVLYKTSDDLRSLIQKSFPEIKYHSPMILNSHNIRALNYEKANIYSIEYQRDNLPSETELIKDLIFLLGIYDYICAQDILDSLIERNMEILNNSDNMDLNENYFNNHISEIPDSDMYSYKNRNDSDKCLNGEDNYNPMSRHDFNRMMDEFNSNFQNIINEVNLNLETTKQNKNIRLENNKRNFKSNSMPRKYPNISVEDVDTYYGPILELFNDGNYHSDVEIFWEIAVILPNNKKYVNLIKTNVSFIIKQFLDAGCLEEMGEMYCITSDGRKLLEMDTDSLDRKILLRYCPEYRKKFHLLFNDKSQPESNIGLGRGKTISVNQLDDKKLSHNNFNYNKIEISEIESKPNKYYNFKKHSNKFKRLSELLSDENVEKLEDIRYLGEEEFNNIIKNIMTTHENVLKKLIEKNNICFEKLSILEKMFLFSKSFVKTHYKKSGDDLGHYRFNEIYIDKREQSDYKKIRTIIHELSHFLFSEILEQILSEILDTDKTDILEAFIFYTLTDVNDFYLIDEYCACTVEGRFVPMGHQDYTSFKNSLKKEHLYSDGDISTYGNTFARYIMFIMESFISENLIKEINEKSSNIYYPLNDDVKYETEEYVEWNDFVDIINMILEYKANYNREEVEDIYRYCLEIQKNNN